MLDRPRMAPGSVRPLRRAEYDRLVELGCFEGERVELVRGVLLAMTPHSPPHDSTVQRLTRFFVQACAGRAEVRIASSFAASDDSAPEPDVAIVPPGDYDRAHPNRAWLVIEVAKSSLVHDRSVKADLYAESRVDEYWIVDLEHRVIEVYRSPRDGAYAERTIYRSDGVIRVLCFHDIEVRVADVLPRE